MFVSGCSNNKSSNSEPNKEDSLKLRLIKGSKYISGYNNPFEQTMLLKRSNVKYDYIEFEPKNAIQHGIYYSNIGKCILLDSTFSVNTLSKHLDFYFPDSSDMRLKDQILYSYANNIHRTDSLINIFQRLQIDLYWNKTIKIDSIYSYMMGIVIDQIADIDTSLLTDEGYDRIIDHRLNLNEIIKLIETRSSIKEYSVLTSIYSLYEKIQIPTVEIVPVTDKNTKVNTLRHRVPISKKMKSQLNYIIEYATNAKYELIHMKKK